MNTRCQHWLATLLFFPSVLLSQAAAQKSLADPLSRSSPRSSVIAFLQACQRGNFNLAAQYLDLRQLPERVRSSDGKLRAKQLEAILNSDSHFDVLRLSQAPEGNALDSPNPSLEVIATVPHDQNFINLELERIQLATGVEVWLFSPATVAAIPTLTPTETASALESHLPDFFRSVRFLDTALWKWLALFIVIVFIVLAFRVVEQLALRIFQVPAIHSVLGQRHNWIRKLLQPWLVLLSAVVLGLAEQFIDPSALSRLYIGRAILLVVVWAFAWCLINLIDLFLSRMDTLLDPRQRLVSHSLIYMGRRAAKVSIAVLAAIIILDNWGYNMTTMIAGLGVGGIAVALAAQGTIANVFGGVSVIADHPVMVGDFGNFGGVIGTVEDIGLRSTRVRTLNRTVMSIPNSAFSTMNLENYAYRDKILFNPTLQIKRGTPRDKIEHLMSSIEAFLKTREGIEVGPSPVRLTSLTAATMALEIFAYTLTSDIDQFYRTEADLFLELDAMLATQQIELA